MITRDEKKKLIQGYISYNSKGTPTIDEHIDQYLDSLEMNKEKAIEILSSFMENVTDYSEGERVGKSIKFAIDYMKSSGEEGKIIGYVNYYPEIKHSHKIGSVTFDSLESAILSTTTEYGECIHIPIRLPIELKPGQ